MSWGYFVNVELQLPRAAWRALGGRVAREVVLPHGWSGLEDGSLEEAFARWDGDGLRFAELVDQRVYTTSGEALARVTTDGDTTTVRVARMLDKSQLELAGPLARLFAAAREVPAARGTFQLVNDGTYSGEDGIEQTLARGKLKTRPLDECFELSTRLGSEIFGLALAAPSRGQRRVARNPFTGEPIELPAPTPGRGAAKRGARPRRRS